MIWSYVAWLPGDELTRVGRASGRWLRARGRLRGLGRVLAHVFRTSDGSASDRDEAVPEPGSVQHALFSGRRALTALAVSYHCTAVALTLMPSGNGFGDARRSLSDALGTRGWLRASGTWQSWGMFSRPRRTNDALQTVVVDHAGKSVTLPNNLFAEKRPIELSNDRVRQMRLHLVRKSKQYRRPWAEYQCRQWELRTGRPPRRVVLARLWSKIPTVADVSSRGAYDPHELEVKREAIGSYDCKGRGRVPLYMKERRGLPITRADQKRAAAARARLKRAFPAD
jgi:hypothetical protein